jgi:hypothetical protein
VEPDPHFVGALCLVLSDFRGPQHDLRAALRGFEARLTPAAAADVRRRCRNLPVPSLRFFLFAAALPGFTHLSESLVILAGSLASARLFPLLRSLLSDLPSSALSRDLFPLLFPARTPVRASQTTVSGPSPPWSGSDSRQRSLICTPSSSHYPIMAW